MPTTRRTATVAAPPAVVWQTVSDPHRLPRWWPRVERVEGVSGQGFTQVMRSKRGALVRADFRIGRRNKPRVIEWSQDVEGTPFAGLLKASVTTVTLDDAPAAGGGTVVELKLVQKLQGGNRLGGFMVKRAARRQLDAALAALGELSRSATPSG
jgi:uncharacterized protein YndB with AHSA1/START domain